MFIGGLLVHAAKELAGIAEAMGKTEDAAKYTIVAEAAKMDAVVREHGWDGDWFRRAYDDFMAR